MLLALPSGSAASRLFSVSFPELSQLKSAAQTCGCRYCATLCHARFLRGEQKVPSPIGFCTFSTGLLTAKLADPNFDLGCVFSKSSSDGIFTNAHLA
jgi:hypothetical protein